MLPRTIYLLVAYWAWFATAVTAMLMPFLVLDPQRAEDAQVIPQPGSAPITAMIFTKNTRSFFRYTDKVIRVMLVFEACVAMLDILVVTSNAFSVSFVITYFSAVTNGIIIGSAAVAVVGVLWIRHYWTTVAVLTVTASLIQWVVDDVILMREQGTSLLGVVLAIIAAGFLFIFAIQAMKLKPVKQALAPHIALGFSASYAFFEGANIVSVTYHSVPIVVIAGGGLAVVSYVYAHWIALRLALIYIKRHIVKDNGYTKMCGKSWFRQSLSAVLISHGYAQDLWDADPDVQKVPLTANTPLSLESTPRTAHA